jgi:hypothetical protein
LCWGSFRAQSAVDASPVSFLPGHVPGCVTTMGFSTRPKQPGFFLSAYFGEVAYFVAYLEKIGKKKATVLRVAFSCKSLIYNGL